MRHVRANYSERRKAVIVPMGQPTASTYLPRIEAEAAADRYAMFAGFELDHMDGAVCTTWGTTNDFYLVPARPIADAIPWDRHTGRGDHKQ